LTDTHLAAKVEAELIVGGMTCASCAARIERRLNKLDGVAAVVNYATERAYVTEAGGHGGFLGRAPEDQEILAEVRRFADAHWAR